ncbi:hypothetical protein C8Q75DRAFT_357178 [Abortiporus biennis]|nr:hypothetical protein C8Q75DRAFT_357178 [Abortiporus biennis]
MSSRLNPFVKDLPIELWETVLSFLDRRDLRPVSLVSKWFSGVAQSRLFSRVDVEISYTKNGHCSQVFSHDDTLDRLDFITGTPRFLKAVRKLNIYQEDESLRSHSPSDCTVEDHKLGPAVLNTTLDTFPRFVNLTSFYGQRLQINKELVENLRSLPRLVSLVLESSLTTSDKDWPESNSSKPFSGTLRRLKVHIAEHIWDVPLFNIAWWSSFLSPSSTETIEFSAGKDSDHILQLLSKPKSPTMTSLHKLTLSKVKRVIESQFVAALSHCPSLRRLSLKSSCPPLSADIVEVELSMAADAAPLLEHVSGPYSVARPLGRYRHLQSIEVSQGREMSGFPDQVDTLEEARLLHEALYEGSRPTLQRFSFKFQTITDELMKDFFTNFPALRNGNILALDDDFTSLENVLSILRQSEFPKYLQNIQVNSFQRFHPPPEDLTYDHPAIAKALEQRCPELCTVTVTTRKTNIIYHAGRLPDSDSDLDSEYSYC